MFDEQGNVALYSAENLHAIRNYLQCLHCADPAYSDYLLRTIRCAFRRAISR